jgi:hypothetical protein
VSISGREVGIAHRGRRRSSHVGVTRGYVWTQDICEMKPLTFSGRDMVPDLDVRLDPGSASEGYDFLDRGVVLES